MRPYILCKGKSGTIIFSASKLLTGAPYKEESDEEEKRIAFALAAALMMVLLLAACSDKTIRLGVAGTGGVYQVFGEDYAALQAQNGGQKLEVRETAGSAASLRLLSSGYLQMAVVQADMAQDAYNQTGALRNLR